MPAQTRRPNSQTELPGGTPSIWFYGAGDTKPLSYQFFNEDSSERDVSALEVYITIAHSLNSPYFMITDRIVDQVLCTNDPQNVSRTIWYPLIGDLRSAGLYQFYFQFVNPVDDRVESYLPLSYDYIRVQPPPGGAVRKAYLGGTP